MPAPQAGSRRARATPAARAAAVVGCGTALGLVVLSARSGGGYFPVEYLSIGVAALVAGAVLLLVTEATRGTASARCAVAVGGLLAYAGWIGLSGGWSPAPDVAAAGFQRNLAYAAVLILGVLTAGRGRGATGLVLTVWVALAGISVAGAASRLLPALELAPLRDSVLADGRLSWPLTYWNAQGLAAAMAVPLALGIAADRRAHVALRATAAGTVPLVATALALSLSRGSVLALAVGLAVFVLCSARPLRSVAVVAATTLPTAVAVALCIAEPAAVEPLGRALDLRTVGPRLFGAAVALGVVAAALAVVGLRAARTVEDTRRRRRLAGAGPGSAAVAGVIVVAVAVLALAAARYDDRIAEGTVGVRSFVDARSSEFTAARPNTALGVERLGTVRGSRADAYRVAIDEFQSAPILGAGTGTYPQLWLRERRGPETIRNAHSLPLETAGETGLVGLALLLAFFGTVVRGVVVVRRRPGAVPRARAAGAAGALAAFAASCCIDWTWQMGTLTAAAMLLAATFLRSERRTAETPVPRSVEHSA
ncbi:O-antigen ligase family protein [Patulibacter sp.]|uniref:O-antigen ligase family protein n=1 Tax=Patulibacter sp. TaxID=1912859 RepID=UPI002728BF07|nr:O-antigen ligase family protein [Patulibacter sp.]MDO9407864.1 O-antigen ligase family protein [Patulibacter sp.]